MHSVENYAKKNSETENTYSRLLKLNLTYDFVFTLKEADLVLSLLKDFGAAKKIHNI